MAGYRKKLIEVALPLDAINAASKREKSIRHGHPSTLHLWWSRKPLAAARAVLFASLVDDPSSHPEQFPTAEDQEVERKRLHGIIERLVVWKNSNDPDLLAEAHAEIVKSCDGELPTVLDPFAGGGTIPLEAQRLGLKAVASDLNPVAVLINKAQIEIPPRFAKCPPVHPGQEGEARLRSWQGAQGLAADIEYYGRWMRDEAERRIGHLYPKITGPNGDELTPIAWLWARTVQSPDPAWNGQVPLVTSWTIANKRGKPKVWVEPVVDRDAQTISYKVHEGGEPSHAATVGRTNSTCVATGAAISRSYIKTEGMAGRMGQALMAVTAEGHRERIYCAPTELHESIAECAPPEWLPRGRIAENSQYMAAPLYGLDEWWKLFTTRQLVALTTFSDLLQEATTAVRNDATASGMADDGLRLRDGGSGAWAYEDAIVTYLAFAVDRLADRHSALCTWDSSKVTIGHTFARQAIPIVWDFAEANPFSASTANWMGMVKWVRKAIADIPASSANGRATQLDARMVVPQHPGAVLATDPPYYDNVPYSDISDFFYVWMRNNLQEIWPNELSTLATPKADELVANRIRAGSRESAETHFESGMAKFVEALATNTNREAPATIFYAYKATENSDGNVRSTGWDTFLQAVVDAGLQINATWPLRTELSNRPRAHESNALASSVVLACRPRDASAPLASRREFLSALKAELPEALRLLRQGGIAPVDMAQAAIGPGMAVFSRYKRVVEASGETMRVRTALQLINETLDEVTREIDADFDTDTRWAVSWFSEFGFEEGEYGRAELLSKSRNTSVAGLEEAGVVKQGAGKVRLLRSDELNPEWDPATDSRFTVWEVAHHLIQRIQQQGEQSAATLLREVGGHGEAAKELAYRLYLVCERKRWNTEALGYNSLVTAWPELTKLAAQAAPTPML